jgi:NADH-quinone oxidoreductase subunit H
MVLVSSIAVTLFLGGWLRPFARVAAFAFLDFVPALVFAAGAVWCVRAVLRLLPGREWRWQRLMLYLLGAGAVLVLLVLLVPLRVEGRLAFPVLEAIQGVFWFMAKVMALLFGFIWFRGTFPRYRFDQLMSLGWRFMIPLAIVNVIFCALGIILSKKSGWNMTASLWLATAATLLVAVLLVGRRRV